ncbi:MAG: exopolysaccharide biosynthesis protein [Limnochordia bacterium]|jgi:hypothetical protein|nr:exopolysaccharide biosynthesis protein [Limnochordia bacterium]
MSLSRTLSDTLACALEQDSVSIESLIAATGQQSYGLLFILVGLFIMIPLPPGGGILPGSLIFFWGIQRLVGHGAPWLPKWLLDRRLSRKNADLLLKKALPLMRKLESFSIAKGTGRPTEMEIRIASWIAGMMGLFIVLPTPFLNRFPALAAILIGLSLVNGNRRLLWIGMVFGAVVFVLMTIFLVTSGDFLLDRVDQYL